MKSTVIRVLTVAALAVAAVMTGVLYAIGVAVNGERFS